MANKYIDGKWRKQRKGAKTWVDVLNYQSLWRSSADLVDMFKALISKSEVHLSESAIQSFMQTLSQMRQIVYAQHFGKELDLSWLQNELATLRLSFVWPDKYDALPMMRTHTLGDSDEELLDSFRGGLLIQFAIDLAQSLSEGEPHVQRCEGLYRDAEAEQVSIVPEVSEELEQLWRKEIPVLVEKTLVESDAEIQRCADLFSASARSKFCSDTCRFSTFQIVKQLKEPGYLAEKQRRYRSKKN